MDKQSSMKIAQVLRDTRETLLSVTAERDSLAEKCAAFERRAEATKVASMLHDKGCRLETDLPELVGELEKEAAAGRLDAIAHAAEMIGPNMSFGTTNQGGEASGGSDAFTNFLVGDVG
jgi:hypothetical protein